MRKRWATFVTISLLLVIGAGAGLAVANGGRDESDRATSDSGGATPAVVAGGGGSAASTAGSEKVASDSAASASTGPVAPDPSGLGGLPTPQLHAQVVKQATLELEVGRRKGDAAVRNVIDDVGLVRGFVESTDQSGGRSRLTVRVPADQFDTTLARLLGLGKQRDLEVHGQDVTGTVTDLDARLRNLRAQEAVLIGLMGKATTIGDSIAVQQQLSQNQEQIEQLDGQRRALADQTTYATIVVSIVPLGAPPVTNDSPTTLGSAWADGVDAALAVTGGTLIVLGALLPILVIGGAGILGWRVMARRQRRAHPAAT